MIRRFFLVLMLLTLGMAASAEDLKLPEWPQSFSLSGDRASFSFPVLQPGSVVVDVTWQGASLTIELVDPAGKVVQTAKSTPAKIERDVTDADVAKGVVWTIVVTDTRVRPASVNLAPVTGQITVQCPPIDLARLKAMIPALEARKVSLARAEQGKLPARSKTPKPKRGVLDLDQQITKRVSQLQAADARAWDATVEKIKGQIKLLPTQQGIAQPKSPVAKPILKPKGADLVMLKMTEPKVLSVSPGYGYAGDQVTVMAQEVTADKVLNEVYFTLAPNSPQRAEIVSVAQSGVSVEFVVKVPEEVAGMKSGQSPVFIRKKSPKNTDYWLDGNSINFSYYVRPCPVIESTSPTAANPFAEIAIIGKNLTAGGKAYFAFPDGHIDWRAANSTGSSSLKTWMPEYRSVNSFPVVMYLENQVQGRTVRSNMVTLTANGTESVVTSMTPTTAEPGTFTTFKGTSLKRIKKIYFQPDPGQENVMFPLPSWGMEVTKPWFIEGGIDTEIYATMHQWASGYSVPLRGRVYAVAEGRTDDITGGTPYVLKPRMEVRPMYDQYSPALTNFQKKDGDDSFTQIAYPIDWEDSTSTRDCWISAKHESGFITGHGGDDYYVMDFTLKNGWTLDHVEFNATNGGGKGARLEGYYLDAAGRPTIKVHWWVDASYKTIWYNVTPYIKGPQGVPYR